MSLRLEWLGPNRWRTVDDYRMQSERLGRTIHIPAGFETDLASVPRAVLWLVDDDDIAESAVVHDHLYRNPVLYKDVSRKQADQVMRDIMKQNRQPRWKRWLVYRGVRWGGWCAWRKWRK